MEEGKKYIEIEKDNMILDHHASHMANPFQQLTHSPSF